MEWAGVSSLDVGGWSAIFGFFLCVRCEILLISGGKEFVVDDGLYI